MLLRRHNLNFLPILRELLRTRSVSQTARNVGLSQSAVSSALARLRDEHGDELLVMVGRGLELTEKAKGLIEQVERACLELELLFQPAPFDPLEQTRRFVIATADYVTYLLAPNVTRALAAEAPRASVQFIDIGDDLESRLARGEIDMLVIPENTAGHFREKFDWAHLFADETVVIAASDHPRLAEGLTRELYEALPHAMFSLGRRGSPSHEALALRRGDVRHADRVLVEQFLTLPVIVESTESVALIQRRIAQRLQHSHAIALHQPPFPIDPLRIAGYWSRSLRRDPAHRWFREMVALAAS